MAWYAVYEVATSAAVSFTTTEPADLPPTLGYVVVAHQPGEGEAWDAASRTIVSYAPVPADPSGALYEIPQDGGAWRWTYAVGPYRLVAGAAGVRSSAPATATAQAYVRANVVVNEITAAIGWATSRRDSIGVALVAAGQTPSQNATYQAAEEVLAFLGGCL